MVSTYSKQSWANGSSGGTPLTATRLQHLEDGLEAVDLAKVDAVSIGVAGGVAELDADGLVPLTRMPDQSVTYAPVFRPNDFTPQSTFKGPFDPTRSLYNFTPGQLRKSRLKLGQAIAGTGLFHVLCAGDSVTAGQGNAAKPDTSSYPAYLRSLLTTRGVPSGGTGVVNTSNNAPGTINSDGRWGTISGAWTSGSAQGSYLKTSTSGATLTFTADKPGTALDLIYLNSSGAFTYSIDGGAAVTVTPPGTTTMGVTTVTGLTNATHTVTITTTSTTTVYFLGVQLRGASGLLLSNGGAGGTKSGDWADTSWFKVGQTTLLAPYSADLVILELGINDALNQVPVATYQANMTSVVQNFQNAGAEVILMAPHYFTTGTYSTFSPVSTATFATYRAALYAVADSMGLPLVDMADRWGSYSQLSGNGAMWDGVHPNSNAYADQGNLLASILLSAA